MHWKNHKVKDKFDADARFLCSATTGGKKKDCMRARGAAVAVKRLFVVQSNQTGNSLG